MPLMNSSDSPFSLEIHQFIAATQPINSLAFVFDGVNFGASDFAYSAYSLASSSRSSSTCLWKFLNENMFINRYSVCLSFSSGFGVDCERRISVSSLQKQWLHWDLDCFDNLYVSAYVCWCMEVFIYYYFFFGQHLFIYLLLLLLLFCHFLNYKKWKFIVIGNELMTKRSWGVQILLFPNIVEQKKIVAIKEMLFATF